MESRSWKTKYLGGAIWEPPVTKEREWLCITYGIRDGYELNDGTIEINGQAVPASDARDIANYLLSCALKSEVYHTVNGPGDHPRREEP